MYDLREAQPVRRSQLRSNLSSPDLSSSSEDGRIKWQLQLDLIYKDEKPELDDALPEKDLPATNGAVEAPDEEAYDFRLFSAKSGKSQGSKDQLPKIRIASPEPTSRDPGFVQPKRPEEFYLAEHSRGRWEQYKAVAIKGEDVLKEAQVRWPGFELPWRVMTLTSKHSKTSAEAALVAQTEMNGKRKWSGKKRRIAIRIKTRHKRGKEEQSREEESRKMELEKEKRNRKNREKKIKKREKARAMKKDGDRKSVV